MAKLMPNLVTLMLFYSVCNNQLKLFEFLTKAFFHS